MGFSNGDADQIASLRYIACLGEVGPNLYSGIGLVIFDNAVKAICHEGRLAT